MCLWFLCATVLGPIFGFEQTPFELIAFPFTELIPFAVPHFRRSSLVLHVGVTDFLPAITWADYPKCPSIPLPSATLSPLLEAISLLRNPVAVWDLRSNTRWFDVSRDTDRGYSPRVSSVTPADFFPDRSVIQSRHLSSLPPPPVRLYHSGLAVPFKEQGGMQCFFVSKAADVHSVALSARNSISVQKSVHPVVRVPVDSGCSAHATNEESRLINVRPCDDRFKVADGKFAWAKSVGDMPVLAKQTDGSIVSFTLTNVRYVPDFKYTLLSVKQLWRDQRADARFADVSRLEFPGPPRFNVPYDSRLELPTVTLVSEHLIDPASLRRLSSAAKTNASSIHTCFIGFHSVKSTAHIARLPAAQASELLHRRSHLGLAKIRQLPHITADAP